MVKRIYNNKQFQTQNNKGDRVSRRVVVSILIVASLFIMACPFVGEFVNFEEVNSELNSLLSTATEEAAQLLNPEQTDPTPEQAIPQSIPNNPPVDLSGSVPNNTGINEYSVSSQDFNCICSVSGNVNVELHVNGDQLEIIDPGGNVQVFDKIGENTYKRSWMGYYIDTTDGKETKVDEEKSVIIILTGTGYIMEHYKGSEGSPCCIYTFTKEN